LHVCQN